MKIEPKWFCINARASPRVDAHSYLGRMHSIRPARAFCIALASAMLLLSCSSERLNATATAGDLSSEEGQEWLDSAITAMTARIEALRGYSFGVRVRGVSVRRESYDSLMRALSSQLGSGTEPEWAMDEKTMVALGLSDSIGQWDAAQANFEQNAVQGFYLPGTGTLYVFDDGSAEDRLYTVAHELEHALQDRLWNLSTIDADVREADEDMARTWAIEAEAEYVSTAVLDGKTSAAAMQAWVDANAFGFDALATAIQYWAQTHSVPMVQILPQVAPYYMGVDLISRRRVRSGWAGVDSLFDRPLRTTRACIVAGAGDSLRDWNPGACPAVSGTFRPLRTGRMGALQFGSLLWGGLVKDLTLGKLADRWRGDRFWSFAGDSGTALLWRTAWKDDTTARAVASSFWARRAARRAAWKLDHDVSVTDTLRTSNTASRDRGTLVRVRGNEVLVAEGFSPAECRDLEAKLAALGDRAGYAARVAGPSFGGGEWRPPVSALPPPRIPGLRP